ncbi:hypothetical protein D1872_287520 [compost metagenome]
MHDHATDVACLIVHGAPVDHVERVVEKMRFDLRLQQARLGLPLRSALFADLVHQIRQPGGHVVEAVGQMGVLLGKGKFDARVEVPALQLPHAFNQLPQRPHDAANEQPGQHGRTQ